MFLIGIILFIPCILKLIKSSGFISILYFIGVIIGATLTLPLLVGPPQKTNSASVEKTIENNSSSIGQNENNDLQQRIKKRISNRTFYNNESGLHTSIRFEPSESDLPLGEMTLTQLGCHIVYTYSIENDKILIAFYGSDCNRTSSNQTLSYNYSEDYVYMNINGQQFKFR